MVTELHPAYLEVAQTIMAGPHGPGTQFTHEWLRERLHVAWPEPDEAWTEKRWTNAQLAYLAGMDGLKETLLHDHRVALASVPGIGYVVLAPEEQLALGERRLSDGVMRALTKGAALLVHVDAHELDAGAMRRRNDALATAGTLVAVLRPPARFDEDDPPPPGYKPRRLG